MCILLAAGMCLAQEPPATNPEDQQQVREALPTSQVQAEAVQAVPIPAGHAEAPRSLGSQTFEGDVFRSARNHWGFSVSAYEAYSTDVSTSSEPRQESGITAFIPRGFFNLGGRRSSFHLELGTGYRHYNRLEDLNSWDYYGNADYSHRFSRRATLQVSDQFRSSYNDSSSFISGYSPLGYNSQSSSSEVLFNRQRITANTITGRLDYQSRRNGRFGVFVGHGFYNYADNTLRNSRGTNLGGEFEYQLARWLSFSTGYNLSFNNAEGSTWDGQIHNLRIANLDFHLTRYWRIWAGGGVAFANYQNDTPPSESVNAGIEYASRNSALSLRYERGYSSAMGLATLMETDTITVAVTQRIRNWLRAWLQPYYYRSRDQSSGGLLKTFTGGGGFEFALHHNLFLTISGFLENQRESDTPIHGLGLNRITTYAGLQYVWPSRRRGDYEGSPSFGQPSLGRARGQ